ncbi:MAG: Glu/Leu/Phe/Val dehydrogenase dimerization domain-containing protein [Myxococcota bacterium]|nr:Glu/Leu/Phe/Val dehydrogenase dimerization domain-containing protein [Myxococcota bacterium]
MAVNWLGLAPEAVARQLRDAGVRRAWIAWDEEAGEVRASHATLEPIAAALGAGALDYRRHEALFLAPAPNGDELFGVFIHSSLRGQAQGGLRHWPYPTLEEFLRDGLRLSLGMARKSALAGLWWGGGKGIIARSPGEIWRDRAHRHAVYQDFARFVTSLRGCYVTAEDAGTGPLDMAEIATHTRFATCVPPEIGGSGNPSAMTALGVVEAMEAALDHCGMGSLADKSVAMQGAGHVGSSMLEQLFDKGVASVVVSDLSADRCESLRSFFENRPIEVRVALPGDDSILAERCDVLVPNALGGILSPKTIPQIQAAIVCGAANNQLENEVRDAAALHECGILYVPDYLANRMGIVACCDEHAGSLPRDPAILAHLDRTNAISIYRATQRVLARAAQRDESPAYSANHLADRAIPEPHPIHGNRAQRIIQSLLGTESRTGTGIG